MDINECSEPLKEGCQDNLNEDPDFLIELDGSKIAGNQNRIKILPFIAEVDRYAINDRAASALQWCS